MEEELFELTIEKSGYNLSEKQEGIVTYNINGDELNYIMEQIKHNVPFVLVVDNDILVFSPQHCISIKITKIN